jgi:hypothetical protein
LWILKNLTPFTVTAARGVFFWLAVEATLVAVMVVLVMSLMTGCGLRFRRDVPTSGRNRPITLRRKVGTIVGSVE